MSILNRIYADYLMPNRLPVYENLLHLAKDNGYHHFTIPEFYLLIKNNQISSERKYFVHRHDIDTDVATGREMFLIEEKMGIKTSHYFRLSTLNNKVMNEMHDAGHEVGYHFEELASFCKDKRIKTAAEAKKYYHQIRDNFRKNFTTVERVAGFKIKTIASHGDFVNRIIGVSNFDFITRDLMDELGIDFECYDKLLLDNYGTILSDASYPNYFRPSSPFDAIQNKHQKIYLLSHPRQWRKNIFINTKDNIIRFYQGIKYM
jgi:hypothetical protein